MLVANVRLFFTPSPSLDIVKRVLKVTSDGSFMEVELPMNVAEHQVRIKANGTVSFMTECTDSENKVVQSVMYTTTLGDLTDPLPDTGLGHEILSVEEVHDEPAPTPV